MSKERARRRQVRAKEAAIVTASRAAEAERRERRDRRGRAVTARLPSRLPDRLLGRRSRPRGILAERRRRQNLVTVALVVALNVLLWVFFPSWPLQTMAVLLSLLVAPVLHVLLHRR